MGKILAFHRLFEPANKTVQQPVPKLLSYKFPFQQGPAKSGSIPKFTLTLSHKV
jgi:hypothetical protein